jgi:pimeloyl-ACP methyl ester carboxylesterase
VLAVDANELHEALGGTADAVIIGHDWGASATYGASVLAPERWSKVVTMAVPPGGAVGKSFPTNHAQLKRSWYMFFFQHRLADVIVPSNNLAFIDMLWNDWSPGYDATVDLANVKTCLADPANLAAALGYYRANLGDGYRDPALDAAQAATHTIPTQPHLYLHGASDGCIGAEVALAACDIVTPNVAIDVLDQCGHFLHLERPEVVNDRIIEFLS